MKFTMSGVHKTGRRLYEDREHVADLADEGELDLIEVHRLYDFGKADGELSKVHVELEILWVGDIGDSSRDAAVGALGGGTISSIGGLTRAP